MAVFSTLENQKDVYLMQTLKSLRESVDFSKHRLILSINGYTHETQLIIKEFDDIIEKCIYNPTNLGTAEAINLAWKERHENQHCIKIDDDVYIYKEGWIELMENIARNNKHIGQIGLKRPDLLESPTNPNPAYRSEMIEVPLDTGHIVVERCNHIIGTCVMHTNELLNKIGYMWQPGIYGFDDSFTSLRSTLSGFLNVFISRDDYKISHLDTGHTDFTKWKIDEASRQWEAYREAHEAFTNGNKDIYYNPFL